MRLKEGLIITSVCSALSGCFTAPVRESEVSYTFPQTDLRTPITASTSSTPRDHPAAHRAAVCPIQWDKESLAGLEEGIKRVNKRDGLWEPIRAVKRVHLTKRLRLAPPRIPIRSKARRLRMFRTSRDLWERIRNGMGLPQPERAEIASEIEWFSLKHVYFDQIVDRARPYLHHIVEEIERREMPLEIALLPIIESAYRPTAYSPAGAAGIWQIVPGTGKRFGLKQNAWYDGRRDILASTQAALDYLGILHKRFEGDWLLALAAYNCGEGAVGNAIERNRRAGLSIDFWSLDLPRETQEYVPKLLAISTIIADPSEHNLVLDPIPNRPYLQEIHTGEGQLSLERVAALANMSIADLRSLNPGLMGPTTDPSGSYKLVIPISKARGLQQRLAAMARGQRLAIVSPDPAGRGKDLSTVARHPTTADLKKKQGGSRKTAQRAHSPRKLGSAGRDLDRRSLKTRAKGNVKLDALRSPNKPGKLVSRKAKKDSSSARHAKINTTQVRKRDGYVCITC
jgi:soluble lytic murein transglycosylase-like protein